MKRLLDIKLLAILSLSIICFRTYAENYKFSENLSAFEKFQSSMNTSDLLYLHNSYQGNSSIITNFKAYPNPYGFARDNNESLKVSYYLKDSKKIKIKLMDLLGNDLQTLVAENQIQGPQNFEFPSQTFGSLPKGYYFLRIEIEGISAGTYRVQF